MITINFMNTSREKSFSNKSAFKRIKKDTSHWTQSQLTSNNLSEIDYNHLNSHLEMESEVRLMKRETLHKQIEPVAFIPKKASNAVNLASLNRLVTNDDRYGTFAPTGIPRVSQHSKTTYLKFQIHMIAHYLFFKDQAKLLFFDDYANSSFYKKLIYSMSTKVFNIVYGKAVFRDIYKQPLSLGSQAISPFARKNVSRALNDRSILLINENLRTSYVNNQGRINKTDIKEVFEKLSTRASVLYNKVLVGEDSFNRILKNYNEGNKAYKLKISLMSIGLHETVKTSIIQKKLNDIKLYLSVVEHLSDTAKLNPGISYCQKASELGIACDFDSLEDYWETIETSIVLKQYDLEHEQNYNKQILHHRNCSTNFKLLCLDNKLTETQIANFTAYLFINRFDQAILNPEAIINYDVNTIPTIYSDDYYNFGKHISEQIAQNDIYKRILNYEEYISFAKQKGNKMSLYDNFFEVLKSGYFESRLLKQEMCVENITQGIMTNVIATYFKEIENDQYYNKRESISYLYLFDKTVSPFFNLEMKPKLIKELLKKFNADKNDFSLLMKLFDLYSNLFSKEMEENSNLKSVLEFKNFGSLVIFGKLLKNKDKSNNIITVLSENAIVLERVKKLSKKVDKNKLLFALPTTIPKTRLNEIYSKTSDLNGLFKLLTFFGSVIYFSKDDVLKLLLIEIKEYLRKNIDANTTDMNNLIKYIKDSFSGNSFKDSVKNIFKYLYNHYMDHKKEKESRLFAIKGGVIKNDIKNKEKDAINFVFSEMNME